jgi:hypothetical protein
MELEGLAVALEDLASGLAVVALMLVWLVGRAYARRRALSEKPSAEFWNWK